VIQIVAVFIALGIGLFARMARRRSFALWALITFAILFVSEFVLRGILVLLLTGITDTTVLTVIIYVSFGAMVLFCAAILPAAPSETDG
jgi:hypothetical protein